MKNMGSNPGQMFGFVLARPYLPSRIIEPYLSIGQHIAPEAIER